MKPPIKIRVKTPVTLIVGIKCEDAIVLASDSQITEGSSKRTDAAKIEAIDFQGLEVLVAQAGSTMLSGRLVDILSKIAPNLAPKRPDDVGEIAQSACRELRKELREFHFNCSSEELDEILRKQGQECAIMLGFFWKGMPQIYTVNLAFGIYERTRAQFEAIGCASVLGKYLLREHLSGPVKARFASLIAIHVIETAKRHDAYCDGPTRIGMIRKDPSDQAISGPILDAQQVDDLVKLITEADAATKAERMDKIHKEFTTRSQDILDTLYWL